MGLLAQSEREYFRAKDWARESKWAINEQGLVWKKGWDKLREGVKRSVWRKAKEGVGKEPKRRNADKEIKEGRKYARVWVQSVIITSYRWCGGYGKRKLLKLTLKHSQRVERFWITQSRKPFWISLYGWNFEACDTCGHTQSQWFNGRC